MFGKELIEAECFAMEFLALMDYRYIMETQMSGLELEKARMGDVTCADYARSTPLHGDGTAKVQKGCPASPDERPYLRFNESSQPLNASNAEEVAKQLGLKIGGLEAKYLNPVANISHGEVCGKEGGFCSCRGVVSYGGSHGGKYNFFVKVVPAGGIHCSNSIFGDPLPGYDKKKCWCLPLPCPKLFKSATTDGIQLGLYAYRKHILDPDPCSGHAFFGQSLIEIGKTGVCVKMVKEVNLFAKNVLVASVASKELTTTDLVSLERYAVATPEQCFNSMLLDNDCKSKEYISYNAKTGGCQCDKMAKCHSLSKAKEHRDFKRYTFNGPQIPTPLRPLTGRSASQSSTISNKLAGLAVDQNSSTCARITDGQANNSWWKVDLGGTAMVTNVRITTVATADENVLKGSVVRLGNSADVTSNPVCFTVTRGMGKGTREVRGSCNGKRGRYLSVDPVTTLCQVEVSLPPENDDLELGQWSSSHYVYRPASFLTVNRNNKWTCGKPEEVRNIDPAKERCHGHKRYGQAHTNVLNGTCAGNNEFTAFGPLNFTMTRFLLNGNSNPLHGMTAAAQKEMRSDFEIDGDKSLTLGDKLKEKDANFWRGNGGRGDVSRHLPVCTLEFVLDNHICRPTVCQNRLQFDPNATIADRMKARVRWETCDLDCCSPDVLGVSRRTASRLVFAAANHHCNEWYLQAVNMIQTMLSLASSAKTLSLSGKCTDFDKSKCPRPSTWPG